MSNLEETKELEKEKIIKIITKKRVDVNYIKECSNVNEYNRRMYWLSTCLTQEEFDLLKRCFK